MPNHFHLLLRQSVKGGISKYMGNFQNSYTRYFNTKYNRSGPLLQSRFKAVRIKTDEQLIHVSRYIHLNPYSSMLVKDIAELENYHYSSFGDYIRYSKNGICETTFILDLFKNRRDYQLFVYSQTDYQRNLAKIKRLIIEDI